MAQKPWQLSRRELLHRMSINPLLIQLLLLSCVGMALCPKALAVNDKDNRGRWNAPVPVGPDKEVPGFLVNLGPTGARAVLTEKTFVVRYIFRGSPAASKLMLGDEITGVFGKPFSSYHFGGISGPFGYEGPIMDLGNAIEKAEGKDGKLVLNVSRGSTMMDIEINLEAIGVFSSTFPMNCRKSEIIRTKALKYLAETKESQDCGPANSSSAVCLALLTSDDPKQKDLGKKMASRWGHSSPDPNAWSWYHSHALITVCEYYLMTKDSSVLPMIKSNVEVLEKTQFMGNIRVAGWDNEKQDPQVQQALLNLNVGGFGHAPYVPMGTRAYGPMQFSTMLAVIGWQLAGQCGVNVKPENLKCALDFIHRGTNASGYLGYGQDGTYLIAGRVDPNAFMKSHGGEDYVGRSGAAIVVHNLSPELPESPSYLLKYVGYLKRAFKSLPDGHADANVGLFWGLMGTGAAGDDTVLRVVLDYHKAYFNMSRCFDGSFTLLPGRDYADDGYYMGAGSSRYLPTATMVLTYGLNNPKLMIQGLQVIIPGINPKALKGRMDTAYKALVKRNYGEAAAALKDAGPDDATVAATMQAYLEVQAQQSVALLEAVEKAGDIERLKTELTKAQAQFGLLPAFKEKVARFEEGFRQEAWILELKLGAEYRRLVEALQRNKSAAYAGDLERFGGKYPDSLYGRWALEVAKEYQASGAIKNPSVAITTTAAPSDAKPLAALSVPGGVAAPTPGSNGGAPSVAAAPAARPQAALSPEALAEWQARFVKKLDALAKAGAKLKVDLGDNQDYVLRSASEASLIVRLQGSDLPMPWRLLSPTYRASLAKSAATDDDVEALLIAAVMQLACNRKDQAEELFAKAALKDAEAVKAARATLNK